MYYIPSSFDFKDYEFNKLVSNELNIYIAALAGVIEII